MGQINAQLIGQLGAARMRAESNLHDGLALFSIQGQVDPRVGCHTRVTMFDPWTIAVPGMRQVVSAPRRKLQNGLQHLALAAVYLGLEFHRLNPTSINR